MITYHVKHFEVIFWSILHYFKFVSNLVLDCVFYDNFRHGDSIGQHVLSILQYYALMHDQSVPPSVPVILQMGTTLATFIFQKIFLQRERGR